ncbi:HAD-IA family hydrolase [Nocardia crassostreae]|uniref:HAD-IA family hydrolase n=1 Tax=Nocardia crassostreae TaxID=53428 RepID=UPI00082F1B01|nr:HAD-IA family hydrolase [Nocardia crassostreae]
MPDFDPTGIRVVLCDIFGTTVDWYTGVGNQATAIAREAGIALDGGAFASAWRERYLPSIETHGWATEFDERARRRMVHAWHRLPAWKDAAEGVRRLRDHYTVAALSNGGFALLTTLIKAESLPFDCILSAELARTYKPAAAAYLKAVELLDVDVTETLMVACHGWDLDGARAAGLRTAFVERSLEKGPHTPADRSADVISDLSVTSFTELADALGR